MGTPIVHRINLFLTGFIESLLAGTVAGTVCFVEQALLGASTIGAASSS